MVKICLFFLWKDVQLHVWSSWHVPDTNKVDGPITEGAESEASSKWLIIII